MLDKYRSKKRISIHLRSTVILVCSSKILYFFYKKDIQQSLTTFADIHLSNILDPTHPVDFDDFQIYFITLNIYHKIIQRLKDGTDILEECTKIFYSLG